MVTDAIKQVIGVFYPVVDPDEALSCVVLEWIDTKICMLESPSPSGREVGVREYRKKGIISFSIIIPVFPVQLRKSEIIFVINLVILDFLRFFLLFLYSLPNNEL
jgi:hypothetical protein